MFTAGRFSLGALLQQLAESAWMHNGVVNNIGGEQHPEAIFEGWASSWRMGKWYPQKVVCLFPWTWSLEIPQAFLAYQVVPPASISSDEYLARGALVVLQASLLTVWRALLCRRCTSSESDLHRRMRGRILGDHKSLRSCVYRLLTYWPVFTSYAFKWQSQWLLPPGMINQWKVWRHSAPPYN